MGTVYNLHYISDLKAYTKGQGIPHWKPSDKLQLGTIIQYNESDAEDVPEDDHVPFGVSVISIPCNEANQRKGTMKAEGASEINSHPIFLDPTSHAVIMKVDVDTKELVPISNASPVIPVNMKFMNPNMTPQTRR